MFNCAICRFDVYLDDTVVISQNGKCICLTCYNNETHNTKTMPPTYRKEVSRFVDSLT